MKYLMIALLIGATALPPASAQQPERNWSQTLKQDATFFRDDVVTNHPGWVNPLDPGFRPMVNAAYKRTMARAEKAQSFPDYFWALREFVASFNDGHVNMGANPIAPALTRSWPGFFTRNRKDVHMVVTRVDDPAVPPVGAILISCDGRPTRALERENVGRFRGMWDLISKREEAGWRLFLNDENPYVRLPQNCLFKVGPEERSYALRWRPASPDELAPHLANATDAFRAPVEARWYGPKGYWFSFGTFGSSPPSEARKLPDIVGRIEADREALRSAETIVFDLRGNSGGSSDWSHRVARALWGEDWFAARRPHFGDIDWRASPGTIKQFDEDIQYWRDQENPGMIEWTQKSQAEVRAALAAKRPFWRQTLPRPKADPAAKPLTNARIFVLTDPACLSACMDALDIWKPLGAIQVGRETSGDTLYIQVRRLQFPSGLGGFITPQKVWRDRPRGSNEPHRPEHVFEGDMSDTAALEKWIAGLAAA
jgi:hypothetical protein